MMTTKLDRLLECLDPDRTIQETFDRSNTALNTFGQAPAQIERWDDFCRCLGEFLRHVEGAVLQPRRSPAESTDYYWSRCMRILHDLYGHQGEKAAFELARTGNEGGLYGILQAVAMKVAEGYSQNEIIARIGVYWDSLSTEEQLAAAAEYLGRFGHLLPSELTEGSAARLRANFPRVLQEHPRLLQRLRQVGR